MAVSLVNFTSTGGAGGAVVTKPAGGANGDIYVVVRQEFNSPGAHTAPSGFTEIDAQRTQTDVTVSAWYRVHNGSEGANFTVGGGVGANSNTACWLLTGVHASTPFLVGANVARTGTNHVTGTISTSGVDGCMLLVMNGTHVTTTMPSGMSLDASLDGDDFVCSHVIQTTGSASTSKTCTNASSNGVHMIVAIQPPPAATGNAVQEDWPTPQRRAYPVGLRTWSQSSMQPTIDPISVKDFPAAKPLPYPQNLRTSITTAQIPDVAVVVSVGVQVAELPMRARPTPVENRTWIENLQMLVEPVPTRTVYELPTKPRPHPQELRTWLQDLDHFVEPLPPGDIVFDLPNKLPPFWWDLRTWIQNLSHFVEPIPPGIQVWEKPTPGRPYPQQNREWVRSPQIIDLVVAAFSTLNYDFSLTRQPIFPQQLRTWLQNNQLLVEDPPPAEQVFDLPNRAKFLQVDGRTWVEGPQIADASAANMDGARIYDLPNRGAPTPLEIRTWLQNLTHFVESTPPARNYELPPRGTVYPRDLRTTLQNLGYMVEVLPSGDIWAELPTKPRPHPQQLRTWIDAQRSADVAEVIFNIVARVLGWDIPILRSRGTDTPIDRGEGNDTPINRFKGSDHNE